MTVLNLIGMHQVRDCTRLAVTLLLDGDSQEYGRNYFSSAKTTTDNMVYCKIMAYTDTHWNEMESEKEMQGYPFQCVGEDMCSLSQNNTWTCL